MSELELALEVTDLVTEVDHRLTTREIEGYAERLLQSHPDADVDRMAVVETIREEQRAAALE